MPFIKKTYLLVLLLNSVVAGLAQIPSHNMGTYTVTDCRAKFYDDGGPTNPYLSVLNTVTSHTLKVFVGSPITFTFSSNPTQTQIQAGDWIYFYNGPNTASPLLGAFTATTAIPTLVATSGSMTIVWTENGNTVGHGWNGGWYSQSIPPLAPTATLASIPSCNANQITLHTNYGVICDSLKPNYFLVNGPMTPGVATVIPMPCSNGTTNVIQINLQNPINQNCHYTINSTLFRLDNCDSAYKFQNIINTFSIANCPIQASINVQSSATVCAYNCNASVTAVTPATACLTFNYQWNNGLPATAGPHAVCPAVTTVYQCTLTEVTTSMQTVVSRTIFVIDPQIAPIPTPTLCQGTNITLQPYGTPTGGVWLGPGITNSVTGFFCSACTSQGVKTLTYQVGSCTATTQITVVQISAGSNDAACLNEPSFNVSGGTPAGGFWFGSPHISPTGVFTPTQVGSFLVTYSVGACSQSKSVQVTSSITVPTNTIQLCKSQWWTNFNNGYGIQPIGGRFSKVGPGITNQVVGTFSPSLAGPGIHIITYSLASGCSATFAVEVLDINVSPTTATTCPSHAPFIPTMTAIPAGGTWSCAIPGAIQNNTTGLFNPSAGGSNSYTTFLVYKATNGCPDTLEMRAIRTNIIGIDSLFFCANSNTLQLSNNFVNINYVPAGGVFSGTGVSMAGINYIFNPAGAGPGVHTVYYTHYTCSDSIKMIVYPTALTAPDLTICSTHPPFQVQQLPPGSTWVGMGITNPTLGIFSPASVPAGNTYTVGFVPKAPLTCADHVSITIYPFVAADIQNLNTTYCYRNQDYTFTTVPANGTLTAPPSVTPNIFNPAAAGSGSIMIKYAFGEGPCHTRDSITINVYPQLTASFTVTKDSICIGESSKITMFASGGIPVPNSYTHTWSHGLIPISSHIVIPQVTTTYTVETNDGCSDPQTNLITIAVAPPFYPNISTTPIRCFGENGQATVNITPPGGNYSYNWNTTPVQTGSILSGTAGKSYQVKIKNLTTGCSRDTFIKIPGYNAIKSRFSPNPNMSCIPFDDNLVSFIDLSNGATAGTWNIGGTSITYTPGQSVQHEFSTPGNHQVILTVRNEGNCTDTYAMDICILESTEIFIPDIFSPNKDGVNDELFVRGNGIKEIVFRIYDRWGNMVFQSNDPKQGWDGTYKGKNAEPGVYAYSLNITMFNDKKINQKGEITLVR